MNELVTMSDTDLDKAIEEIKERELALQTNSGQAFVVSKMRELIMYLEKLGYKIDADELALARLWANGLSEDYARLGDNGMKMAVQYWAEHDTNEYRTFPQIPWIKEVCEEIGGDPRIEKGRRVQALAERQMELDHKKQNEEFLRKHPDLAARIEKQIAERSAHGEDQMLNG